MHPMLQETDLSKNSISHVTALQHHWKYSK